MVYVKQIRAVYRGGTFIPRGPCDIPEGSEVELIVRDLLVIPPEVTDITQKESILKIVTDRMISNPIPDGAPVLTREAL